MKKIVMIIGITIASTIMLFLFGLFIYFLLGGFSIVDKDHKIYKDFKDKCVIKDKMDVPIDWEKINSKLNSIDTEKYGIYDPFKDEPEDIETTQKRLNVRFYYNYPINEENDNSYNSGKFLIRYGAIRCSSRYWTTEAEQEYWFSEPMIEFYFYNKERLDEYKAKDKYTIAGQPLYELGYKAVFSVDGKLALEEGKWFLEDDKDEFLQKYLKKMQDILNQTK